jgi:uncharacterized protein (DUF58 family)
MAILAAVAGPLPALIPFVALIGAAFVIFALADFALGYARVEPVKIALPPLVRLTKDRKGSVPLVISNERRIERTLRLGVAWPAGIESSDEDRVVGLPGGAAQARIELTCTPRKRGRFGGLLVCWEVASVFGLWHLRGRERLTGELRVYPNLFGERKQLAALFLARTQQGALSRRVVGRGREFEKLREYLPGDGFDEIHWKATAKRGRPVTKVFQVERTQEIYVVLDVSRLSARVVEHDGITQTALERCITASLVLLLAAERMGDRFGLVAYDDRVRLFLRAGRGETHYGACREAMLGLRASEATPDVPEIVRHLRTSLRQRALLFFLTDLTDPVLAEDFARHAGILARQHLVVISQLRQPGVAPLFSGEEVRDDSEVYARLAGHLRWAETRTLAKKLKPAGVDTIWLENEGMAAQLVTQYLQVKRRQAL